MRILYSVFHMIVSLHPCITKDINILCAGRSLTAREKNRLKKARAIIVSQGVTAEVYRECRKMSSNVFPNYDLRFPMEGKVGDNLLFEYFQVPHPKTLIFRNPESFWENYPNLEILPTILSGYPIILKADRGGEGAFVFLIRSPEELEEKINTVSQGLSSQDGFVLQERIDHGGKDLRVVILFDLFQAYWRLQPDPNQFRTNQSQGARIELEGDIRLKDRGINSVQNFCEKSGINLAAFDIIFNRKDKSAIPLFLEINYYFGRRGLGGSMKFYEMFEQAADRWLTSL